MLKLRDGIIELYKKVATSIPPDVEEALKNALAREELSAARDSLSSIIERIRSSRQARQPVCLDPGIPTFRVKIPRGLSHTDIRNTIREATVIATQKIPLNPNAVDVITGKNSGDNTGIGFPVIYLEEALDDTLSVDLLLSDAGCESLSLTYVLPCTEPQAAMDLEGVQTCVLDAVTRAQGRGCPPYIISVGVGATKDQATVLAKLQLFRRLTDSSEHPRIVELEESLLGRINSLAIGPAGSRGMTTAVGVKIGISHRHPSSCVVDINLGCWAIRRGKLLW